MDQIREENHRFLSSIAMLKNELQKAHLEFESLSKNVKMLTSETQSLDQLLNEGRTRPGKMDMGYSGGSSSSTFKTIFIGHRIQSIINRRTKVLSRVSRRGGSVITTDNQVTSDPFVFNCMVFPQIIDLFKIHHLEKVLMVFRDLKCLMIHLNVTLHLHLFKVL